MEINKGKNNIPTIMVGHAAAEGEHSLVLGISSELGDLGLDVRQQGRDCVRTVA
jgi:hypothetical protein